MLLLVSYLAVAGRVLFLALERAAIKRLGAQAPPLATTLAFFTTATLSLVPVSGHALVDYVHRAPWLGQPAQVLGVGGALLAAVIAYTLAFTAYAASLSTGEISVVGPLAHVNALFLLVLAFWFHHEPLTAWRIMGTVMVVWGGIALGRRGRKRSRGGGRAQGGGGMAAIFMVAYAFLLSVGRITDKYATVTLDMPIGVYTFVTYSLVTICLALICLAAGNLRYAVRLLRARPKLSILAGTFTAYAFFFLVVAIQRLDLTVAEPLSGMAALVSLWLGAAVFDERLEGKMAPSALIVLGSSLILA